MFWKKVLKVLESIVVGLFAILGAICITPFAVIYLLISLPVDAIIDVWGD